MLIRKMELNDHIDIAKYVYTEADINVLEQNVINNVKHMESSGNWIYLVAEAENKVVATAYLEKKMHHLHQHIGEIYSVVVADSYREKGIAKALINKIIDYGKELNLEYLILYVRSGTIAETVYQKLGFIKYGSLPNGIKDNGVYFDQTSYYYKL